MSLNKIVVEQQVQSSWEQFVSSGMEAREKKDNSQWELGDLAKEVETEYGEDTIGKYAYAIGVEKKTMMNYRTIADRFTPDIRKKYAKLSFSHFSAISTVVKPEAWLEKADDEDWAVEHLRNEIKKAYPSDNEIDDDEKPPEVYRCPECNLWRLKDMSSFDICRGHYVAGKEGIKYQ